MTKHFIIPDVQAKPGLNFDHLKACGRYMLDKKPEVIVCLGDFWDMPSLSEYDRGKKSFEGRRYKADIEAGHEAMQALLGPMQEYNKRQKRNKKATYSPRMVFLMGNHCYRIQRAIEKDPILEGTIGYHDLKLEGYGWEVHNFIDTVEIRHCATTSLPKPALSSREGERCVCVSPHLPPERGPSASLPAVLGSELRASGVESDYVAYLPNTPFGPAPVPGTWRVPRPGRSPFARSWAGAMVASLRIARVARPPIARADLVHLHGSGLVIEVAAEIAERLGKPWVITLYGTDVWHHEPRKDRRYARLVHRAACRAFYSAALLERARDLGLGTRPAVVTRAPAPRSFRLWQAGERDELRRSLGVGGPVLLTVKRLRPDAGHEVLLAAMPQVIARHPGVRLVLAGDGEMRQSLETMAAKLRIAGHVRFIGTVNEAVVSRWCAQRCQHWGRCVQILHKPDRRCDRQQRQEHRGSGVHGLHQPYKDRDRQQRHEHRMPCVRWHDEPDS